MRGSSLKTSWSDQHVDARASERALRSRVLCSCAWATRSARASRRTSRAGRGSWVSVYRDTGSRSSVGRDKQQQQQQQLRETSSRTPASSFPCSGLPFTIKAQQWNIASKRCVYWTRLYDEQRDRYLPGHPDLEVDILATDPDEQVLLSGSRGPEGNFSFTSRRPGGHRICLRSHSSRRPLVAGGALALHLHLRVGDRANDYADIAAEGELTELQLRVRRLTEQLHHIQKDQDYYRLRVKALRWVHCSTSRWIFW
ncbi:transmembrane emp24 domain-containing protein 9-like isoform X2 [Pseudoliparis swirei]|nr:transmembrane emp24 domain-containing protein 9-like isoform X2 [Pseudoliparis swirei]